MNDIEGRHHIPAISEKTFEIVSEALESLMNKARFGLPGPVKEFKIAHQGTSWGGKRVHLWIYIQNTTIALRIFQRRSRPKRVVLRELNSSSEPPTLCIYEWMKPETIVHKLAECIKIGLNRLRRGLINISPRNIIDRCQVPRFKIATSGAFGHSFEAFSI